MSLMDDDLHDPEFYSDEPELIDHPRVSDFWCHEPPKPRPCVECGEDTPWIYLDMAYLHPKCDFQFGAPDTEKE